MVIELEEFRIIQQIKQRESKIRDIKFSPDGNYLAAGDHDGFIDIYNVKQGFVRIGTCKARLFIQFSILYYFILGTF
jgi:WD40 repeat protein